MSDKFQAVMLCWSTFLRADSQIAIHCTAKMKKNLSMIKYGTSPFHGSKGAISFFHPREFSVMIYSWVCGNFPVDPCFYFHTPSPPPPSLVQYGNGYRVFKTCIERIILIETRCFSYGERTWFYGKISMYARFFLFYLPYSVSSP